MNNLTKNVVIVGGGSLGLSMCYQLVMKAIQNNCACKLAVTIVEPRKIIGAGQAYENDLCTNLLNTRVDTMSLVYEEPHHFLDWLTVNEYHWKQQFPNVNIAPSEFVPRPLFGMYLEHTYKKLVNTAKNKDIKIKHSQCEVIDLQERGDGLIVHLSDGRYINADYAVLAIGNLRSTTFDEFSENSNFFNSPYPTREIVEKIPEDASIGILGSSLSAIDAIVALSNRTASKGKILSFSKSGRLPSVRGANNSKHKLSLLTKETIDDYHKRSPGGISLTDVVNLLSLEISGAQEEPLDVKNIMNSEACMHSYLSEEIISSTSGSRTWQSVIYSTNSIVDYLWHKMNIRDKRLFWNQFRSLWFSYRVSFPVENAKKLHQLMRNDKLSFYGGVQNVNYHPESQRYEIEIQNPENDTGELVYTSYLINATGFSDTVEKSDMPLIKRLLERNLAKPSEFGGFDVDYDSGHLIKRNGILSSRLYIVGSMATGTYFFTNAMDVNARHAMLRANDIIIKISSDKHSIAKNSDKPNELQTLH